jgi:hypothetical protein
LMQAPLPAWTRHGPAQVRGLGDVERRAGAGDGSTRLVALTDGATPAPLCPEQPAARRRL